MSAVLPVTEPEVTEEDFKKLWDEEANKIGQTQVDENGFKYNELIIPQELRRFALKNPQIWSMHQKLYPGQIDEKTVNTQVNDIFSTRIEPYLRPAKPWVEADEYPKYHALMEEYAKDPGSYALRYGNQGMANYKPTKPADYDNKKAYRRIGWDLDDPDVEYNPPSFSKQNSLIELSLALGPRTETIRSVTHILKTSGVPFEEGSVRYVNPKKPGMGVRFFNTETKKDVILDTDDIDIGDVTQFILREGPVIAADYYSGKKATEFLETIETAIPLSGFWEKARQITGLAGASGLATATADFSRYALGSMLGVNDLSADEILKKSGITGLLATGGTVVISTLARVIPGLYEMATNKMVPASYYRLLREGEERAAKEADPNWVPDPQDTFGVRMPMSELYEAIDDMGQAIGRDLLADYNPTLGARTGVSRVVALEQVFLELASDPKNAEMFLRLKEGNQSVINAFMRALDDSLESIAKGGDNSVTSVELQTEIRTLIESRRDELLQQGKNALDDFTNTLNGADSATVDDLYSQVVSDRSSEVISRTIPRLAEIRQNYLKESRTEFLDLVEGTPDNPSKYANLRTGARFTKGPTKNWLNINKGRGQSLFKSVDDPEALALFESMLRDDTVVSRLLGREATEVFTPSTSQKAMPGDMYRQVKPGKFKNPEFSLAELNASREALNEFASTTKNIKASEAARSLESGLENQMNQLLRDGARNEMLKQNLKVTPRKLTEYIRETKYGEDVGAAWSKNTNRLAQANSDFYVSLAAQRPESVVEAILKTNIRNADVNTKIKPVVDMLEMAGASELGSIRRAMAAHIKLNILNNPLYKTPREASDAYRKFWVENKGTLTTLFGKELTGKNFNSLSTLQNFDRTVLKRIDESDAALKELELTFGRGDAGEIVTDILNLSGDKKEAGLAFARVKALQELVGKSPELNKQIAQVSKDWLTKKILQPIPGNPGSFTVDHNALSRFLYEGFGPLGVGSPKLSAEAFFAPLLGKGGKEYVKNLKVLNALLEREAGLNMLEPSLLKGYSRNVVPATEFMRRFLIAPLTQIGRRLTAAEKSVANRNSAFLGQLLMDDKALNSTLNYMKGKYTTEMYLRMLASYGATVYWDVINDEYAYNPDLKMDNKPEQKNEPSEATFTFALRQLMNEKTKQLKEERERNQSDDFKEEGN